MKKTECRQESHWKGVSQSMDLNGGAQERSGHRERQTPPKKTPEEKKLIIEELAGKQFNIDANTD